MMNMLDDVVIGPWAVLALHISGCVAPTSSTFSTNPPVYTWPLGTGINRHELVTGTWAGTSHNVAFYKGAAGSLNYNATVFSKSDSSYVDLPVPYSSKLTVDFSISFYLMVEPGGDGVILNYQSDSTLIGVINNIILEIATGDFVIILTEGGGSTSAVTAATNLAYGQWYRIVLERDLNQESLNIYIDGTAIEVVFAVWVKGKVTGFPGTLRLGMGQQGSSPFSGAITCVQIVDTKNPITAAEYDNECKTPKWPPLTTSTTTTTTTTTATTTAPTTTTTPTTMPSPTTTTMPSTAATTTPTTPTTTLPPATPMMFPAKVVETFYTGTSHFKLTSYNATYAFYDHVLGMSTLGREDCVWLCVMDSLCGTFVVKAGICLLGVAAPTLTHSANSSMYTLIYRFP